MRGRVMSLYGMISRGAPAIGAIVMGSLAEVLGFQAPVLGGAILLVLWWWASQRHRGMVEPWSVRYSQRQSLSSFTVTIR